MSFTFAQLKTAIQDYSDNAETSFVSHLSDFIKAAEERVFKLVDLEVFRKNVTSALTQNDKFLRVPTDYLNSFSLQITTSGSENVLELKDINFLQDKSSDQLFSTFPDKVKALQWHSYEVVNLENNKDITLLASSPTTKYQIFKYQDHAYGIQFHIEVKDTTVNDWGCVVEYKSALEEQFGQGALEKFDKEAKSNMSQMNNCSKILYSNFKKII